MYAVRNGTETEARTYLRMRDRYEPAMVTCLFHKNEKIALEIRLVGDVLLQAGWFSMRCLRWRRH